MRRSEWKEEQRTEWLLSELTGKRPLLPPGLQCTPEVAEVLSTFRILAELPPDSLGAYVISMAHTASDVLAVVLLQVQRCLLHLRICVHAPACQPSLQTQSATDSWSSVVILQMQRSHARHVRVHVTGLTTSRRHGSHRRLPALPVQHLAHSCSLGQLLRPDSAHATPSCSACPREGADARGIAS